MIGKTWLQIALTSHKQAMRNCCTRERSAQRAAMRWGELPAWSTCALAPRQGMPSLWTLLSARQPQIHFHHLLVTCNWCQCVGTSPTAKQLWNQLVPDHSPQRWRTRTFWDFLYRWNVGATRIFNALPCNDRSQAKACKHCFQTYVIGSKHHETSCMLA